MRAFSTRGIYGPLFIGSSPSAVLQSSLESRLRAELDGHGSPEYVLTWKTLDMPSGPPICALRASARRTSDNGSSGWPTASARDWRDGRSNQHGVNARPLNEVAMLAGWPSPATPSGGRSVSIEKMDATGRTMDGRKHTASLEHAVKFAGWPTPDAGTTGAKDATNRQGGASLAHLAGWPTPQSVEPTSRKRPSRAATGRTTEYLGRTVQLAGWPTPDAQAMNLGADPETHLARLERLKAKHHNGNGAGLTLGVASQMAGWATLTAGDARNGRNRTANRSNPQSRHHDGQTLSDQVHGMTANGFRASTAKPAALNPDFTRWLMGYPPAHLSSAPTAMRSSRKSRRPSSPPTCAQVDGEALAPLESPRAVPCTAGTPR